MNYFFENHGVNILSQHVEQEPVADLRLLDYDVNALFPDQSEPDVQKVGTDSGWKNNDQPVEHYKGGQDSKDEEPEPNKNVDLFVDDVDGQNAKGIMALDVTRWSKLVETAFGHSWENVNDRVYPLLLISHLKRDDLNTKSEEGSVQKAVHEKKLSWNHGSTEFWGSDASVSSHSRSKSLTSRSVDVSVSVS